MEEKPNVWETLRGYFNCHCCNYIGNFGTFWNPLLI